MNGDDEPQIVERRVSRTERLLAGLQAGIVAYFALFLWLGAVSRLEGRSFWTIPNIAAGLFYGLASFRPDFNIYTWSGIALLLLICVLFGMSAAQIIPPDGLLLRSLAVGVLLSSAWFYLWEAFFWRNFFPPFAIYSRRPAIFFGHVLIGVCVGLYSIFVRPPRTSENPD
jgi:hypothetical protein